MKNKDHLLGQLTRVGGALPLEYCLYITRSLGGHPIFQIPIIWVLKLDIDWRRLPPSGQIYRLQLWNLEGWRDEEIMDQSGSR